MTVSPDNSALVPSYTYWRDALAGKKPKMFVDCPELGFFRKGVYVKEPNVRSKRVGWTPVAIFLNANKALCAIIGTHGRDKILTDRDEINELWSFVAANPISEETYRAVAERGEPWHDDPPVIPAADRDVPKAHNAPPQEDVPPDVEHATAVDNAIAAAVKAVTNEAEAAQAAGSKNRIAELRLAADKAGKAIYDPIYRVYTAEQKKWSPIIARAVAEEKRLTTAILTFREKERVKAAAAAAEAARKQREQDEANERAAQRAIARGEPEDVPMVVETVPVLPTPATITPTYGTRKVKEELKKFAVIEDWTKVFAYFQADQEVRDRLGKLATEAVRAGVTVPGAWSAREGLL